MLTTITLRRPADAVIVAGAILRSYPDGRIFTLTGDLGAGKTTLIKGFCEVLGVKELASSPSFSIVNEYIAMGGGPVFHFDLYRLKDEQELEEIGFEEYIDSGNYCFVEWPAIAIGSLPAGTIALDITIGPGQHRTIRISILH